MSPWLHDDHPAQKKSGAHLKHIADLKPS